MFYLGQNVTNKKQAALNISMQFLFLSVVIIIVYICLKARSTSLLIFKIRKKASYLPLSEVYRMIFSFEAD